MKLPKKQTNRKKILLVVVAIVLVMAIGAAWFLWMRPAASSTVAPVNTINYNPPTEAEKQETAAQKDQIIKNQETPPPSPELGVIIVRSFQDPSGVNIRTDVSGTTTGDCVLQFTQNGQIAVTKTFPVVFEATSSHCQNTSIAPQDFAAGGTWKLSVVVKKEGAQSAAAIADVTVNK